MLRGFPCNKARLMAVALSEPPKEQFVPKPPDGFPNPASKSSHDATSKNNPK